MESSDVVYLFHHLPKCGGRSFIHQCARWLPRFHERIGSYPTAEQIAAVAERPLDLDRLPRPCFVHGHLVQAGVRPFERYADAIAHGRCRVITVVRDPLERGISAFYHRQRKGRPWHGSLDHWLLRNQNSMARFLGVDERNWRERLDRYHVIGTTESLDLTLRVFAHRIGRQPAAPPHVNVSPRAPYQLDPGTVETFRHANALDLAIHAYATDRILRDARALDAG